jgi:aspartyl-tRNA(Asn)/glutamyl-tRNA(Gln) amidotransferase subunit B
MQFEPVIGLEIHVEMLTSSKMFCSCAVVDLPSAEPNSAVCPICAGHPGTLPVPNIKAIEYGYKVAAALSCTLATTSVFSRKNYFYPDLPKGYQITQYDEPIASNGMITLYTSQGYRDIRIRRVHLEEDTGKLTHATSANETYSLVDLNRAGVPLLEIVTEPDFHSAEEVRVYAEYLRALVRYLGVNSGDLEKGVMRIEPNISVRPVGQEELGTKVEIKNLNSFRILERGVDFEIKRHIALIESGGKVKQETVGWDEAKQETYSQRSKEDAHDYRYFPEPDIPPITVDREWLNGLYSSLPETPWEKAKRFVEQYQLQRQEAWQLAGDIDTCTFFEAVVKENPAVSIRTVFSWVTGELMALLSSRNASILNSPITAKGLADLLGTILDGTINHQTAKTLLVDMFDSGKTAKDIILAKNLGQVSDSTLINDLIATVLQENEPEVQSYQDGKVTVINFLFGQVMKKAQGKANPLVVRTELERQLNHGK